MHMSIPSNRRFSIVSFVSGTVFLLSGFCALFFQTPRVMDVFLGICVWSVPVLLIALVVDVCRKRYWAFVPLTLLVATLIVAALLVRATAQGMCCGG